MTNACRSSAVDPQVNDKCLHVLYSGSTRVFRHKGWALSLSGLRFLDSPAFSFCCSYSEPVRMTAGFALTSNFQYFTGLRSAYTEKESAVSQTCRLLFCLTSSQKEKEKKKA